MDKVVSYACRRVFIGDEREGGSFKAFKVRLPGV